MPTMAEDILSIEMDRVPGFIQEHTAAKTLSDLMRRLNEQMMTGDARARRMAERALEHLGFVTV